MAGKQRKCLYPGCDRREEISSEDGRFIRGNCLTHYSRHYQQVRRGKTTWEELELTGLVTPAAPGPSTDYDEVLRRAKAKAGSK